ncbi:MAG: hypothetical protein ACRBBN_19320 [Methyloligellaceae bacterium]
MISRPGSLRSRAPMGRRYAPGGGRLQSGPTVLPFFLSHGKFATLTGSDGAALGAGVRLHPVRTCGPFGFCF